MPPQRGHDYFTELPLELLQEIASHLPLYHKLKLRTILKKQQENIVVELLGNGIKNLYVSPTTASLDRFTKICESSFFQQNVKEICFLPFVIVPTGLLQRSTFSEYRDAFPQFSEAEALMSFAMYNSVVDQHQAESDDQPQPQSNLVDIVDILEAGIIKMTQVETVSVQLITQEDGMNGFALHHGKWYHNSNMFKSSPPSKALNDIKTAAMKTAAKLPVIRHIERFLQAVRNSGINFRHLALGRHTLGQYHKAQLPFSIQHIGGLTVETTTSVLSNVTELTISCENSKPFYNEEMVRFWQKVAVSATNIKQLTIFPYASSKSTNWVVPGTGIEVIDQFLDFGHYRDLHSLDLKGRLRCPSVVNLHRLEVFLFKHRRTLREVRLFGVRVSVSPEDARESDQDKTACDGLRNFATNLRTWIPALQTFDMKIGSRPRYRLYGNHWMARSKMEALAAEMGVELGKDKVWDFGKVASEPK